MFAMLANPNTGLINPILKPVQATLIAFITLEIVIGLFVFFTLCITLRNERKR